MRRILASGTLRAMLARLFRGLGFLAYGLLILLVFGLAAYTSFSLFVRSGVTTVPSVVGLSRAEATNRLVDQGLAVNAKGTERYDEKVPAGHIARQTPDARTLVKRGSAVNVVLSLGPQRVTVPVLAGKSLSLPSAQAALSGSGLALGQILGAFGKADSVPGTVLEQDPDPSATIAPSTPVDLLLVMAVPRDRYIMPDLVYRDYDLVRSRFERGGFRFGNVKFERYEGVAAGVILRQFPLPGHPLTKEDAISLVVATADALLPPGAPLPDAPLAPPPAPEEGAGEENR
jgi:beta-lactam-binding protein with PASTA domain